MSSPDRHVPPRTSWRIGDRTELPGGVEVAWRLDPPGRHRHRPFSRHRPPETAVVENVSDGGAAVIVAGPAADLRPGDEVVIGLGDARATVQIVRFEDVDAGHRRYGVRFVRVGTGFRAALLAGRTGPPAMPGRPTGTPDVPGGAATDVWRNSH